MKNFFKRFTFLELGIIFLLAAAIPVAAGVRIDGGLVEKFKRITAKTATITTLNYGTLNPAIDLSSRVPTSTTVNGHALSANVTVIVADLAAGALADGMTATNQTAGDNTNKLATDAFVQSATRLGSWVDKSSNYTAQQAPTDGFVVAYSYKTAAIAELTIFTDGNANPTTERFHNSCPIGEYVGAMCPVRKNDYWKLAASGSATNVTVFWIPSGN